MINTYTATDQGWISDKHKRIAEIIADYDPTLSVSWIPANSRLPEDKGREFAIVHSPPGKKPYVVMYIDQDQMDERVLAKLWESDNMTLSKLDAMNAAVEALRMKEEMEKQEERADLVSHILKSPKARYRHNGVVFE